MRHFQPSLAGWNLCLAAHYPTVLTVGYDRIFPLAGKILEYSFKIYRYPADTNDVPPGTFELLRNFQTTPKINALFSTIPCGMEFVFGGALFPPFWRWAKIGFPLQGNEFVEISTNGNFGMITKLLIVN